MIFLPFFFTNGWIFRGGNFNRVSPLENFDQNWEQIYLIKSVFLKKTDCAFVFFVKRERKNIIPGIFTKPPPAIQRGKKPFGKGFPQD